MSGIEHIGGRFDSAHLIHVLLSLSYIIVFFIAGAVIYKWQNFNKNNRKSTLSFLIPIEEWASRTVLTDVVLYLIPKSRAFKFIVGNAIVGATIANWVSTAMRDFFGDQAKSSASALALVTIGAFAFLGRDFMNFLSHYLHHKVSLLWEFHKVHHSATFLNPLTVERFHPIQVQLDAIAEGIGIGAPFGVAAYFYQISIPEAVIVLLNVNLLTSLMILAPLQHSHIPLGFGWLERFICSPRMHQVHHSLEPQHQNKNFGTTLAIWDILFNTFHRTIPTEKVTFGIGNDEEFEYLSPLRCYGVPFVKAYGLLHNGMLGLKSGHGDPHPVAKVGRLAPRTAPDSCNDVPDEVIPH